MCSFSKTLQLQGSKDVLLKMGSKVLTLSGTDSARRESRHARTAAATMTALAAMLGARKSAAARLRHCLFGTHE